MEFPISENLKRLRREKNITQEKLARVLNISPQSVSKWERGETYPDITVLVPIANYFDVTVDSLLGNDQIMSEARIRRYIHECSELTQSDDFEERKKVLSVARQAYNEFSYDHRIVMLYVNMLKLYGTESDSTEITRLCNIVMEECTDEKLLSDARQHLNGLTSPKDRYDFISKYIEYGENWDWLKAYPPESDEGKTLRQHEIADQWWHLNVYIDNYYNADEPENSGYSHKERIEFIRRQEKVFYAMFDEDDLGEYTFYVGYYNEKLAVEYAALDLAEEALGCLEKAADGWIEYDSLPAEYVYKNPLLNCRPYVRRNEESDAYFPARMMNDIMAEEVFDFVRDTDRFRRICERLTEYAR